MTDITDEKNNTSDGNNSPLISAYAFYFGITGRKDSYEKLYAERVG